MQIPRAASFVIGSRPRVLLVSLALLALLDVGRSVYSRIGFAHPTDRWEPDPRTYANLTWPPGADVPTTASAGMRSYARYCATCHGPDGRGNGPAAPSLTPRPLDFTQGRFKFKSTAAGEPPSDADLRRVVAEGLRASAMPYFSDILGAEEIQQVVAHIKTLSPVFADSTPHPIAVSPPPAPDALSLSRGRTLYQGQGCAACHGIDGRSRTTLRDASGHAVIATNLTAPWTFAGGSEPEQIWLRLTTGMAPGPMPAIADRTTPDERWDLVNYVRSLRRAAPWEPGGKLEGPGHQANLTKRGEYLVRAEICGLCHTQINSTGIYRKDDAYLGGGQRVSAYPHGVFVTSNLTSSVENGIGGWTEAQIAAATREGRARGRRLNLWTMPWHFLYSHSAEDAVAIARYLKTLPSVDNRIPAALHAGFIETTVAKLGRPFPAADPRVVSFADGNFGQPPADRSRAVPQRLLVGAQGLLLLLAAVAFILAAPPGRRFPHDTRGRVRALAAALLLAIAGFSAWVAYQRPAVAIFPPEKVADVATSSIPTPDPARLGSREEAALAARGRYIYTVASCAMCHDNDGAGGRKINWAPFGTLWVSNISADAQTGVGMWSDRELMRAIRSGIGRDGRVLHWQAMTWDYAANFDEEDIRALVVFLRTLPPVRRVIPPPRPPAADDCVIYTFWVEASGVPGCDGR